MTAPLVVFPLLVAAAVFAVSDGDRGEIISRTADAATVRVESYRMSCIGAPVKRFVGGEGEWERLEERPWSGVILDGEQLPHAMCCIATCNRVERASLDLRRYERVDAGEAGQMREYVSAPVDGPLRATFHLHADPACTIPRQIDVTLDL